MNMWGLNEHLQVSSLILVYSGSQAIPYSTGCLCFVEAFWPASEVQELDSRP